VWRIIPRWKHSKVTQSDIELEPITGAQGKSVEPLLLHGRTDYLTSRYSERNERQMKIIDKLVKKI
jgi:hypothetical protein